MKNAIRASNIVKDNQCMILIKNQNYYILIYLIPFLKQYQNQKYYNVK